MFRKVRDHLTIDAKRAFYICSIQSILEYGSNSFAHCLSASLHDRVVRLSNRALRIVYCMPRLSDVSLVLARYHFIPLSVRYQFKLYVLTYRALHDYYYYYYQIFDRATDLASVFVANCFCLRSNSTCTSSRTRSQVSSSLATAKRRYGLFSVTFLGSDCWNALPAEVRSSSSLHTFRNSVLHFLGYPVKRP